MISVAVEERSRKNMKYSEDEVEEMEIANSDDEKEKEEEEEGTPSNKRPKTLPKTSDSPKAVSGGQARGSHPSSSNSKERSSK